MFDSLLELSGWNDSNKRSNVGFGQEMDILEMKICTLSGALQFIAHMKILIYKKWRPRPVLLLQQNGDTQDQMLGWSGETLFAIWKLLYCMIQFMFLYSLILM